MTASAPAVTAGPAWRGSPTVAITLAPNVCALTASTVRSGRGSGPVILDGDGTSYLLRRPAGVPQPVPGE
ncbi:hypothetical protein [Nocardia sp. SYP-A9097]|uniref:hypothetical protein n=1 Tax=Nocardia sp. SYP-A9097 TaxID=2663237 RepID=UPI00129AF659|nr:hypothetical protein [Nocardia sp. SYP-A9097]